MSNDLNVKEIERLRKQRDAYETQALAEGRIVHKCNNEIERLRADLEKRTKDYVDLAIEVERLKLRLHVKGQQTTEADNWEDEGGSTHE